MNSNDVKNVTVLLSTYNGEKFLKKQIDSILRQKGVNVHLLVRDDASKDATCQILEEYKKRNLLDWYAGENLGPANSFLSLLDKAPESCYFAFADQDDVWYEEKLLMAVELIEKNAFNSKTPVLYTSNQLLIDSNERILNYRFDPQKEIKVNLIKALCYNELSGCTMVFNAAVRDLLKFSDIRPSADILRLRMHDVWLILVTCLFGQVIYDKNSYILYRIHEKNTVGIRKKTLKSGIKNAIKKIKVPLSRNGRSRTAAELLKIYGTKISHEDFYILYLFANYQKIRMGKIRLITNKTIRKSCPDKFIIFFLKVLIGWV